MYTHTHTQLTVVPVVVGRPVDPVVVGRAEKGFAVLLAVAEGGRSVVVGCEGVLEAEDTRTGATPPPRGCMPV